MANCTPFVRQYGILLNALNIELNLDEKDTPVMDTEPEQENEQPEKRTQDRER